MDIAQAGEGFDEQWYLRAYRDVAEAVRAGERLSGLDHYLKQGRDEGRLPFSQFEATWYAASYPVAVAETGTTDAAALEYHYRVIGRHRGYLAEPFADRSADGAASSFAGLWIDLPNAVDLLDGKREIGSIDAVEQEMLRAFIQGGYVILRNAVPSDVLDRAAAALDDAYAGGRAEMLFECGALSDSLIPWADGVRDHSAKALDIHWFYEEILDLIFTEPLVRFLNLIFERPLLASQTLGFYRGSGQPLHQDSAYVTYSLPTQFAASWIALEDIQPDSGELEYLVGSHRALPQFQYPGGVRSPWEAERLGCSQELLDREVEKHERAIETEGRRLGLDRQRFTAKKGDLLIWHADLAHGGTPPSLVKTRKSLVTHYCPREIAPLYFERSQVGALLAHGQNLYSSALY